MGFRINGVANKNMYAEIADRPSAPASTASRRSPRASASALSIVTSTSVARGMERADSREAAAAALHQSAIAEHLCDMHATVLPSGEGRTLKEGRAR